MARIEIRGIDEITKKLEKLGDAGEAIGKAAVYEGAKIAADELRARVEALPVDKNRWLSGGDQYNVVTAGDKKDLADHLSIRKIEADEMGVFTEIRFTGYGSRPTKKYRGGLPMAMLARSIESGSSVRKKHPFVRPTAAKVRQPAKAAMERKARELIAATLGR